MRKFEVYGSASTGYFNSTGNSVVIGKIADIEADKYDIYEGEISFSTGSNAEWKQIATFARGSWTYVREVK